VAELWVAHLGSVPYEEGLALQLELRERRRAGDLPDLLLVLEHPPVYTKGRRTQPGDLPMDESWYRERGIEVCETDRGGRVTYHGPGQLVAYPVMQVERVADFVHAMEGAIVRVSAGISTHGLAVNVDNDLTPFEWIVPCGIDHVRMTSIARETGRRRSLPCFRKRMAWRFAEAFGLRQRLVSERRLLENPIPAQPAEPAAPGVPVPA
jgi:lipoyl(octanoyl) transferase